MTVPRLKTVFRPLGHTRPLIDGRVEPSGFTIDFVDVPVLVKGFRRMVRSLEFDVCEMAMTTYICARSHGKKFTALPIFPARGLHHAAIVYNEESDIRNPKDLEGHKVGINRGYTVTTGVWARGILQDEYGVDLDKVTWLLSGDEHVEEYQAPANVRSIGSQETLEDLLQNRQIAAAIGGRFEGENIAPIIKNPEDAAFEALRTRGLYPINHTVVVRDELLHANPLLAANIFNAFARAKRLYIDRLKEQSIANPTDADDLNQRIMAITGDPLPYGIEPNRKVLEKLIEHAVGQHIIERPIAVNDLFAEGTHNLVA